MDKVLIKDLHVRGIIGINPSERVTPQDMLISITVFTDIGAAAVSDDVADCIDYFTLSQSIQNHAETAERFTVEALAQDIANIVLAHPRAAKVGVEVLKTTAVPFAKAVGVRITRSRATG